MDLASGLSILCRIGKHVADTLQEAGRVGIHPKRSAITDDRNSVYGNALFPHLSPAES